MSGDTVTAASGVYAGRVEVVSGPTGRRRWPDAVKARIVQESFQPGTHVSAVARRHGITPQQLTGWRRAARDGLLALDGDAEARANDVPSFVPLEMGHDPASEADGETGREGVEIVARRVTVRLPGDADAARIAAVAAELAVRL